ncbi:intradiol ring-cleavage dioxygenase [Fulvimarina sp. 2208YS6-2-32]|uniref:Intradiol ring-cleavage dioxygenase n=1 Tax=Fulvimarina uroteuthidis TaxID=3098149 RepID=A0ABU5HYN1_9HYPH|nr:intradiol ring-cleavage dioxygenase [Fulvimarina sp. 2208YS6-2-32]MDY8108170.1 intradiol ring-cleavage dioxygenase [Fulvimarina sp. 2208YS6-2-32]
MALRPVNRRTFAAGLVAALAMPHLAANARAETGFGTVRLVRTPACGNDPLTPAQTAGPFFSSGSPRKANFTRDSEGGAPILLFGLVLDRDCRPVPGAKIDIWHADAAGRYDNSGFRLRGHQFSDDQGRWRVQTILPGLYPGRTRHIHVRVQPRGGSILTTQLYFPRIAQNRRDGLFDPNLLMAFDPGAGRGRFDFVV